jgi:hypothetical protein
MGLNELEQILNAFISKLNEACPKPIKTSLSLIEKYKDKLTKHKRKRISNVLDKSWYELVGMQHSNKYHFKEEGLDGLVSSLKIQSAEFKNEEDHIGDWKYLLENFKLYHGTISTRLKSIQQKGLDPAERERFYTKGNLKRFLQLLSKAEELKPISNRSVFTLLDRNEGELNKVIHLTSSKKTAIRYAKMGVETFYQIELVMDIIFKSDRLTAQEKHEAQKIGRPFINEKQQGKPVILHIDLRAPALNIPWLQSFDEYKLFISKKCQGERPWFNPGSLEMHPIGQALREVIISDKIPYKFIKVEYIK